MVHLVFNRPTGKLKIYAADGSLWDVIDAGGDAWGDPNYGSNGPMPPGHYVLGAPQRFAPIVSEGAGQIPVADIDAAATSALVNGGKASVVDGGLTIGGIIAQTGQLAAFSRSAIMLHGGGSNLATLDPPQDPLAPYQQLCKTEGCTRLHNADAARLADFLDANAAGNTVVYTALGRPLTLPF
ncbi:MAG TPA: L,D-transpeptidase family protein [Candidatus Elarobacter sp.]|nr:L,D-transpeptidase family protein [Candidatus Elarobacter sp.]